MPPRQQAKPQKPAIPAGAGSRIVPIVRSLRKHYPNARTALRYSSPFELLIATILSAQCTDEMVNRVTPELFASYPDPPSMAAARPADVERIVHPTGFFRQKTRSIIGCAAAICDRHGGQVPATMDDLVALPGVARKTANVLLANVSPGRGHGIFVDTHVRRVSQRLQLTAHDNPDKIERDLLELVPKGRWAEVPHQLIELGRGPCEAKRPDHRACPLLRWCPTGQEALAQPAGQSAAARRAARPTRKRPTRKRSARRETGAN